VQGVILVFDMTDRSSLEGLDYWIEELKTNIKGRLSPVWLLIGNKMDLWDETHHDHVQQSIACEFAKKLQCLLVMCSAKSNKGIQEAFRMLVGKVGSNDRGGVMEWSCSAIFFPFC
jgi:Ras-related protein Rab-18